MRILSFLIATALLAQEPMSIKVDVGLVNVAFIVRDPSGAPTGNGAPAGNLTRDDIEVYEDGVRQNVQFFDRSADLPLRLGLIMDVSGSQDKFNKRHTQDIGKFVASAVEPRDRALLVCFGNHIRLVSDFTGASKELVAAMNEFQKSGKKIAEMDPDDTREGGTALFDSLFVVAKEKFASPARERRAIMLFSDGEDNSSAHDLLDAIEAAQTADAAIYTVRYTEAGKKGLTARNRYGMREMDRLAQETGGASFDASKQDVAKALGSVAEDLRSMYDVGYVSSNAERDGRFRKVEIRLKRTGLIVRAKPGYYAR